MLSARWKLLPPLPQQLQTVTVFSQGADLVAPVQFSCRKPRRHYLTNLFKTEEYPEFGIFVQRVFRLVSQIRFLEHGALL